ncbi:hypothetical protein V8E53_008253 [Lactarius tabidus]
MSTSEAPLKAENLNEISDSIAAMVACILQEQLAPILETVREHSRLLDWHSALLNHSTLMNRYNVGKLDDLRDLQTNVNYKLQFHIDPEDRKRPTYRGTPPTSVSQLVAVTTRTNSSPQTGHSPPTPLSPLVPPPSCTDKAAAPHSETSDSAASQPSEPSPTTRLSKRAAGKKRKREDDVSEAHTAGTSDPGCDEPERKRKKDTTISTERVPISENFLRVARLNIFGEPSFEERQCEVEQMRYMRNLFRGT